MKKTTQNLNATNGSQLDIRYKIPTAHICNKGICISTTFILVKNLNQPVILGTPFLSLIQPFSVTHNGLSTSLMNEPILFQLIHQPMETEIHSLKENLVFKEKTNLLD